MCFLYPDTQVQSWGTGGSTRACHAAGPGLMPGRDKLPGWGFFGVFAHLQDKCQEVLGPKVPEYHLAIIIIITHHSLRAPMTWDVDALLNLKYTYIHQNTQPTTLYNLWKFVGRVLFHSIQWIYYMSNTSTHYFVISHWRSWVPYIKTLSQQPCTICESL